MDRERGQVAEQGAVVGGDQREAEAGVAMLRAGGNAVDAVVAAAFVGFVVEPAMCGVGGYGRLAAAMAGHNRALVVDGFSLAPLRAQSDMFRPVSGAVNPYGWSIVEGGLNERGHLSVGVPSAVGCLCTAHERLGRLPLRQVLQPAVDLAAAGLPVTDRQAEYIGGYETELRRFPATAAWLLPGGRVPRPGERLDLADLAATLRRIADEGPAGFYAGPFAAALQAEMVAGGGLLRADDLSRYAPRAYEEEPQAYRGHRYVTAGDQISYETLHILECFDLSDLDPDGADYRHLMAEALGHAFVDSLTHYGDPHVVRSPLAGLSSKAFGRARAGDFRRERAAPRPIAPGDPWPYDSGNDPGTRPAGPTQARFSGTSQMAAVDHWGNIVALCTSLESAYGSMVTVPGTGVLLTNLMVNFDARPGFPNSIAPGKMPIFAAPVLVLRDADGSLFATCGSGGYRIETGCLHTLVNALDHGMALQAAADAPRVHCQGRETCVDERIAGTVIDELAGRGHEVVVQPHGAGMGMINFGRIVALHRTADGLIHMGTNPTAMTGSLGY
jgi:gamma-glutamyltranspeptidase/glutathione hydrolase